MEWPKLSSPPPTLRCRHPLYSQFLTAKKCFDHDSSKSIG
ncbi:hypothetical protein FDUTEX481_06581 [Tolypothrix sp. PCC 7601]|nr:hypothetical protein FDUTEX481_06581 [Tolypothrix sp. PCC 7601]